MEVSISGGRKKVNKLSQELKDKEERIKEFRDMLINANKVFSSLSKHESFSEGIQISMRGNAYAIKELLTNHKDKEE